MHAYHEGLGCPDATILYDGCEECEERAAAGIQGVFALDTNNFWLLWQRMLRTDYGFDNGADHYLTQAEAQLGSRLYNMAVLMERHMGIDPRYVPIRVPA